MSDDECSSDRDRRCIRSAARRAAGVGAQAPCRTERTCGGAKMHYTEYEYRTPMQAMSRAYAAYVSPAIDVGQYGFARAGEYRVAVHHTERAADVVDAIRRWGARAAGYVLVQDSLVPAALSPGERLALARS